MKNKKTVIFAGGNISGVDNSHIDNSFIIAVDKGFEFLITNNINIDIAIGDFDSIDSRYIDKLNNIEVLSFNKDKDFTDLELAYEFCLENQYSEIIVYGATGTRLDHSLANIQLLKGYKEKGLNITIVNENNIMFYSNQDMIIKKQLENISILPANLKTVISLEGVKWELKKFEMYYGKALTVSNKFIDDAKLTIHQGGVYIILSKD